MDTKRVTKLTLVMMELTILIILYDVQANNLTNTSLCSFSLPIQLSYSSQVDEVRETMYICLTSIVEECKSSISFPVTDLNYDLCIFKGFSHYIRHFKRSEDPIMFPFLKCIKLKCMKEKLDLTIFVRCSLECYEMHVTKHSPTKRP
jgi:hypothetical protein